MINLIKTVKKFLFCYQELFIFCILLSLSSSKNTQYLLKQSNILLYFSKLEESERKNYLQQSRMAQETQKVNNVLSILLPKFVRDRISAGLFYIFNEK